MDVSRLPRCPFVCYWRIFVIASLSVANSIFERCIVVERIVSANDAVMPSASGVLCDVLLRNDAAERCRKHVTADHRAVWTTSRDSFFECGFYCVA